ncbi:hypothetical protein I4U23_006081 [Adineta vaga]|nr:hypothetical protein I4U23_006081 [Adineta vaga]
MLTQLIRNLNKTRFVSLRTLSTSNVLFQKSDGSKKSTEKASNSKNQQQKQQKQDKNRSTSDPEQERSQQEGPADRAAERKSKS